MDEQAVGRHEYDEFKQTTERRLKGHDEMYEDVSDFKAALRELTAVLRNTGNDLSTVMKDSRDPDGKCAKCKESIEKRIDDINRWRWKIMGAVGLFLAVPTVVSCVILIRQLAEGGLK